MDMLDVVYCGEKNSKKQQNKKTIHVHITAHARDTERRTCQYEQNSSNCKTATVAATAT
jgi:hypothetical protein